MRNGVRGVAAAALGALVVVLSACSSSSSSKANAGSDGRVKLRVTSLGLCEELGFVAQDAGFFKKHGLDVQFVSAQGGNAGVAALQAGAADVVFITSAAAFNAMSQGVDLQFASGAVRTGPRTNGLIVKAGSSIRTPRDLVGKKVGVLELSGMSTTMVKMWVEKAIGRPANIKFVQLPFPELVPAVLHGTVDAAHVTSAEIYGLTKDGSGMSIGSPVYQVPGGSTPTGMYAASASFMTKNQKAMKEFVAAMQDAADMANDPSDTKHFDIMSSHCKKPAADLAKIPSDARPTFEGYIDRTSFMRIVKVAHEAKLIPSSFHPETKVADFAWTTKG